MRVSRAGASGDGKKTSYMPCLYMVCVCVCVVVAVRVFVCLCLFVSLFGAGFVGAQ